MNSGLCRVPRGGSAAFAASGRSAWPRRCAPCWPPAGVPRTRSTGSSILPTERYEPIASACEKSSDGAYKVNIVLLPFLTDGQREELVRLLASHNPTVDVINVDPPYNRSSPTPDGYSRSPRTRRASCSTESSRPPSKARCGGASSTARPGRPTLSCSGTGSRWPRRPASTNRGYVHVGGDARRGAKDGHHHRGAGRQDESFAVWVNAMVLGAGGQILENNELARTPPWRSTRPRGRRRPRSSSDGHLEGRDSHAVRVARRGGSTPSRAPTVASWSTGRTSTPSPYADVQAR